MGGEYRITPQFAVRAGGMWKTNSLKSHLKNGNSVVFTSGTIPHYTMNKSLESNYSVGFGYRFTPNFYMDLACVYSVHKDDLYPFSNIDVTIEETGKVERWVQASPGELKTNRTSLFLTLGYKF